MNDLSGDIWGDVSCDNAVDFSDISGTNGPELWDAILGRLANPGAVVAGGAVRDYLLGVPPKDIDIFVPSCNLMPPNCFDSLWQDERTEEYEAMDTIDVVVRGQIAGFTVDLIGVAEFASGLDLIETFDFGISRCFYDGVIVSHPQATLDRENKTVTLLIDDRLERAHRRFERFNERMGGGWRLVHA